MNAFLTLSPAHRRIWALLFATAVLLSGFPQAALAESEEACLTASINAARREQGSRSLSTDSRLVSIARRHSARMAEQQRYYHNGNLRNELPSGWRSEGENVGWATDCGYMHNFFMNSPAHRKNILGASFTHIGVGVVTDSAGKLWVTEVFMESAGQGGLSEPRPPLTAPPPDASPPFAEKVPEPASSANAKGATARPGPKPATPSPQATLYTKPSGKTGSEQQKTTSPPSRAATKASSEPETETALGIFGWEGSPSETTPILFDLEASGQI